MALIMDSETTTLTYSVLLSYFVRPRMTKDSIAFSPCKIKKKKEAIRKIYVYIQV